MAVSKVIDAGVEIEVGKSPDYQAVTPLPARNRGTPYSKSPPSTLKGSPAWSTTIPVQPAAVIPSLSGDTDVLVEDVNVVATPINTITIAVDVTPQKACGVKRGAIDHPGDDDNVDTPLLEKL